MGPIFFTFFFHCGARAEMLCGGATFGDAIYAQGRCGTCADILGNLVRVRGGWGGDYLRIGERSGSMVRGRIVVRGEREY